MKKISVIIFFFILLAAGIFLYFSQHKNTVQIANETKPAEGSKPNTNSVGNNASAQKLFVSGWLPYWEKENGVASLAGNMDLFDEINVFDYGVDQNGNVVDTAGVDSAPWPQLRKNMNVIPTILWSDTIAMHKIFSDQTLLNNHADGIIAMLGRENYSGIDIDYEGKDVADKNNFSAFLRLLHAKLQSENKTLECTVEARTEDNPPQGWSGTRAMAWANDYVILNNNCDSVRVMAYDQAFQTHGQHQLFEDPAENPTAPNADLQWAQKVMNYALKYIAPEKLMLGVPTYGWEFKIEKISTGYRYTRVGAISYPQAIKEAAQAGVTPTRDAGGELSFVYNTSNGQHLVTFSDAESVRQKIALAQQLKIKGISLFKIDGLSDLQLFPVMKNALGR